MSERYNHAPIISAILDVQAEQADSRETFFQQDANFEDPDYPTRQVIRGINPTVAGTTVGAAATQTSAGVLYQSSDQKQFFRLTPDGFTFVRLNPYIN